MALPNNIPVRVVVFAVLITALCACASAQAPAYKAPRTADGHPNLSGIWQSINTADWDLQAHAAKAGPVVELGATAAIPAGLGVVEGGEIPYLPAAAAKKKENAANWVKLDPEVKCYLPGIPRATYLPFPFQIVQGPKRIMFAYEYASASRIVNMGSPTKAPDDFWMGWSNGHWDGDTLVIDVTNQKEETWFDRAGDFHSDALHVTERYTPTSPDALMYEAQIEDPKTFSRPWKIAMPLYRRLEKNAQLLDFKCPEFVEDLLYGHLKKKTGP
ncbi:MAG TPA: hypothetical protein VGR73_11955 [Bryobacteraceae bacterium]|nr:hypothetical protein [Bryobacteraceae bacterium]